MDYTLWNIVLTLLVVSFIGDLVPTVSGWQEEWRPNYVSEIPEYLSTNEMFEGENGNNDSFKLLRVEEDRVFIGSRNRVYYLKFGNFKQISTLQWEPDGMSTSTCVRRGKKECDNYMRVMVWKDVENVYYICGTYAYQPRCRHYIIDDNGKFKMIKSGNEVGTGISPFNPSHNSTAIYVDGKMFAATVSDADGRDPLILQKVNDTVLVRTHTRDSIFLNEPNFVSSFEHHDKVFFFFRETAVENINCGKAVFSRVARVCKNDRGSVRHQNTFTSFFKARLNCSIPGEFPFYFDEIQSTSEFGQGNYRPTSDSGDRADMIYGVFNTPENSIKGSAICAFTYTQIEETFKGRFKGQESYLHNWLPVGWDETPKPQPAMCSRDSQQLSYTTLNFIKKHPLMDEAVNTVGGMPLLVFTSFTSKFTQIAVDWQVRAADGKYYDIMFVGTDDGRVIKAINKGTDKIESVIIEDIQVLDKGDPVVGLKLLSNRGAMNPLLVVVSKRRAVSISLHRCSNATTCRACVALQDPYCVWNENLKCINAQIGLQNIATGRHGGCGEEPKVEAVPVSTPSVVDPHPTCSCPVGMGSGRSKVIETDEKDKSIKIADPDSDHKSDDTKDGQIAASTTTATSTGTALEIVIVAVIVSVICSLVLGFIIGFKFQSCRYARDRDNVFSDRNYSSLQRGRNRLSSGDNPYFHTDHSNLTPKQTNCVVGLTPGKTNPGVETKPVTKSNKVYL